MKPINPTALSTTTSAPASYERTDTAPSAQSAAAVPTQQRKYNIEAADIVALGVLALALTASLIAIIIALGFTLGRVSGVDAFKIIGACVGGSTISGIVAALIGGRS